MGYFIAKRKSTSGFDASFHDAGDWDDEIFWDVHKSAPPLLQVQLTRESMHEHAMLSTALLWLWHRPLVREVKRRFPRYRCLLVDVEMRVGAWISHEYSLFRNKEIIRGAVDTERTQAVGGHIDDAIIYVLNEDKVRGLPIFEDPASGPFNLFVSGEFIGLLKDLYPAKKRNNVRFPPIGDAHAYGYPY